MFLISPPLPKSPLLGVEEKISLREPLCVALRAADFVVS